MLLPLTIATLAVALGAVLGLGGRRASLSAIQTFALVSALVVVLAQLLPDALASAGLWALGVFAAAATLPSLLEKLGDKFGGGGGRLGLELSYGALLIHKVGDGLGLGTYGGHQHAGHGHLDVLLAIGAHTVPVTALLTLAYLRRANFKTALLRAFGLAVATVVGVGAAAIVPSSSFTRFEPWITAGVAGLLLHVVAHDWIPERGGRRIGGRLIDMAALLAGLALVFVGGHAHHEGGGGIRLAMGEALVELFVETAPALLLGLGIAAILSSLGSKIPATWLQRGSALRQAVRGAVVGAPLPICACGVLPLAQSLRTRGAGPALVVAFLLSTPELGVETFALTARFMGWPFAMIRLGAALTVAVVAALLLHAGYRKRSPIAGGLGEGEGGAKEGEACASEACANEACADQIQEEAPEPDDACCTTGCESDTSSADTAQAPGLALTIRRVLVSFDDLVHHVAPWTVVGLLAAALVQSVLPGESLESMRSFGLDVLVISLVAVPSYVCAASATPLAAILLAKGISPGAVLVGLLLGPATNLATVGFLRKSYGGKATAIGLGGLILTSWLLAAGLNISGLSFEVGPAAIGAEEHGIFAYASAVVLLLILIRSIWNDGIRNWLGSLGESMSAGRGGWGTANAEESPDPEDHDHHGHSHHGHSH